MESLECVEAAVSEFIRQPDISAALALLRQNLPAKARLYLVGGAIRNLIIQRTWGRAHRTEDIDIFLGGLPDDFSLTGLLIGEALERTDLDGVRWHPKGCVAAFDLCLLQNFVIFVKYRLQPGRLNLLGCIDFNVNAAVFDVAAGRLHQKGCIAAIEKRCLDFNTHRYYTLQLLAYRVLLIRRKTGFRVSESVYSFIRNRLSLQDLSDLKSLFAFKLGARRAAALMADYDRICSFGHYADYESQWTT